MKSRFFFFLRTNIIRVPDKTIHYNFLLVPVVSIIYIYTFTYNFYYYYYYTTEFLHTSDREKKHYLREHTTLFLDLFIPRPTTTVVGISYVCVCVYISKDVYWFFIYSCAQRYNLEFPQKK